MSDFVITGKTRVCGVIGDPIEHTMSPVLHNNAYRELGLDYIYTAFRVKPEELEQAVQGMRGLGITGLNVTIPHKVNIIPFLDELGPLAERIGAVNTITNTNGYLKGYNTDATGFLRALKDKNVDPKGKEVLVLGAGGASRAISFILAESGASLTILNRREELDWAEGLAKQISEVFHRKIKAMEMTEANLETIIKRSDILVNTTSVGMLPKADVTPVPARLLTSEKIVFDIVYNPVKTRLRTEAEAAGCQTIGGLDMLVWQGALAFEMWTGKMPPADIMKKEAVKVLEGK